MASGASSHACNVGCSVTPLGRSRVSGRNASTVAKRSKIGVTTGNSYTVATAIQVNLATITISESEVTKRLASYAALVAVPTMIAGIYGMNFKHMPELDWVLGYPMAIAAMVVLDAVLFWRFRKAGWI